MERYNFKSVESYWQNYWEKNNFFKTKLDKNKKKFYCLEMFFSVQDFGSKLFCLAAFSAGIPNESHPI